MMIMKLALGLGLIVMICGFIFYTGKTVTTCAPYENFGAAPYENFATPPYQTGC